MISIIYDEDDDVKENHEVTEFALKMTENAFSLQDTDVMFAPNLCIRNV